MNLKLNNPLPRVGDRDENILNLKSENENETRGDLSIPSMEYTSANL